ncbi:MAG: hypothetical protein ACRDGP_08475, partial [Actinomycetota bacterium]
IAASLAVVPSTAGASEPAVTETIPVGGEQFVCDDATYTLVSGEIHFIVHEGSSASGNENFTLTAPQNVLAVSDDPSTEGETFRIVGAFWVGGTLNAKKGTAQFTVTDHFQIVDGGGGTVGDVQVTSHATFVPPDKLVVKDFNFGTCSSP